MGRYWREAFNILQIIIRKWRWISQTLRKGNQSIAKPALDWNTQGARRRGRSQQTWSRTVSEETILLPLLIALCECYQQQLGKRQKITNLQTEYPQNIASVILPLISTATMGNAKFIFFRPSNPLLPLQPSASKKFSADWGDLPKAVSSQPPWATPHWLIAHNLYE